MSFSGSWSDAHLLTDKHSQSYLLLISVDIIVASYSHAEKSDDRKKTQETYNYVYPSDD